MTWEYKTFASTVMTETILNRFGKDGWELCGTTFNTNFIFKRPTKIAKLVSTKGPMAKGSKIRHKNTIPLAKIGKGTVVSPF